MLQSDHYSGTGKAHLWSHNIYRAWVANYNLYLCLHSKSWHVLSPEYNCSITNAEWKREFFSVWNGANALAKPSSHSSPLHYIALTKEREKEREKKQSATGETETVPFLLRSCEVVKLLPFLPIFISIWLYIFPCVCFYIFANRLAIHFACNVVHSILGLSVCFGARRQNHTKQRWRSYARELFVCLLFLHSAA